MTRKRVMAVLLALTMVLSLVMAMPMVSMAAEKPLEVVDVDFNKDGEPIYAICNGNIGADVYLTNSANYEVNVFATVSKFTNDGLSDISLVRKTVPARAAVTKVTVPAIETTTSDTYKIRIWDTNLTPVCDDVYLPVSNGEKKITAFSVKIGNYTYNADINEKTKEITVFVPTRYMANDAGIGYVEKTGEDHGLVTSDANFVKAINAGITPTIEGIGTISGVGEAKDFSEPVEYTVTAEDGSSVVYTAKIVENESRMFHKSGTASAASNGLPHPRDGWRVKNSGQAEPSGNYAWLDAEGRTAVTSQKVTVEGVANQVFQLTKSNPSTNDTFYLYAPNKPANWGYQQTQIAEVTMSLSNLTEGDGFAISYFEKEGYANKNSNLIFKKVSGKDEMELYWSRGGLGNPAKIDTAEPIALGQMHTYRVVRTMNPEKLSTGKYAGNVALYVDGKYIFSVTETNYLSFNGIEDGSDHNGAYNMMMFGSVTNATALNGGVTYTLTIDEIKYQTDLYDDAVTTTLADVKEITVAGKEYTPLYKEGVYTYIVPSDADISTVVPTVEPVSEFASVTNTEGSLANEEGMTITVANALTGAEATYTVKANKMAYLFGTDFEGETVEETLPEGYSISAANATLEADPTNAENKAVKYVKTGKNWASNFMIIGSGTTSTKGYATSFKLLFNACDGGSSYPALAIATLGKQGPVIDVYRGDNATYGNLGVRGQRESIDAGGSTYAPENLILGDDGVTAMRTTYNKWYEITYVLVPTTDTENYPYGYYFDVYVDGVHKLTYKDGIGIANKTPLDVITDAHLSINTPFSVSQYGGFNSNGTFYFDDVETYYTPAQ